MLSILIPNRCEVNIDSLVREIEARYPGCQIIIAIDREGRGKGWALREALKQAKGQYIVFLDGDMDIKPRMLDRLIPFLEDFDVVVGSKRMTNAPLHRKIITHLSRIYIRLLFGLQVDTQTGIKLFRRFALEDWKTDGFAFDIEILKKARKRHRKIIEVPVEAEITESMSLRAVWKTLKESIKIALH